MTHHGDPPSLDELVAVLVGRPEWHQRAACRDMSVDQFFPVRGRPFAAAFAACRRCPVRQQCLDEALGASDDHGIWGGVGGERRRKVLRRGVA
jgi:WhiB family redox-sensing transcriptional regulator